LSVGSSEHPDVAIEKLRDFFDGIEGEGEIIFLYKNVQDVVFVDAEHAAEIGLQCECSLDF
jgi:hypothetical protein